jgi:predicted site-specific integrase-resolvase
MTVSHLHQMDLARRWRISPRTLERWRYVGTGPTYLKIGGRVVYRVSDIEVYEQASVRDHPDSRQNGR